MLRRPAPALPDAVLEYAPFEAALLGFDTSLVHLDGHFVKLERSDVTAPMQAHRHTQTHHA